jgi:diamine N-acetyltransferase
MTDGNDKQSAAVELRPIDAGNWRDVAGLQVTDAQRDFVAEPCYYLALCHYGQLWQPLAICSGGAVVGMMMWAIDEADGSCWLGGIIIDRRQQGRGLGRAAVLAAMEKLRAEQGCGQFAMSYRAENQRARELYRRIGFIETGEREDDELVARLDLAAEA